MAQFFLMKSGQETAFGRHNHGFLWPLPPFLLLLPICMRAKSGSMQPMKTLQIVSQANKIPFASSGCQPAQRKLPKPHHFLDVAEDRLNRALAQFVDRLSHCGAQLVEHLGLVVGIVWRRFWFAFQECPPIALVTFPAGRDVPPQIRALHLRVGKGQKKYRSGGKPQWSSHSFYALGDSL